MQFTTSRDRKPMSDEALAKLGAPDLVYIRPVVARDLVEELGESGEGMLGDVPEDTMLFSVHAADGTRMAVIDDRDTAFSLALEHSKRPVNVH